MPISGRHDLPLATFNLPSRVFRYGCRRAGCPERRRGGFFHTLSRGQDLPPANPLKTNGNNTQTIVIPEFSGAATAVRENVRNLPRQRVGTPMRKQTPPGILSHAIQRRFA